MYFTTSLLEYSDFKINIRQSIDPVFVVIFFYISHRYDMFEEGC